MSQQERRRLTVFSRVKQGAISVAEAGRLLEFSERQARRLWKRYRQKGDAGLVHGLRGRESNAGRSELKARALALYRTNYVDFSASHASEFLAREKIKVPRNTLWRWLKAEGLIVHPRRAKQHRRRRECRSCFGELCRWTEARVVYDNRILQIEKKHQALALAGKKIEVLDRANGTLGLLHQGRTLAFRELPARPAKPAAIKRKPPASTRWRPGPDHYWNRRPACSRKAGVAAR